LGGISCSVAEGREMSGSLALGRVPGEGLGAGHGQGLGAEGPGTGAAAGSGAGRASRREECRDFRAGWESLGTPVS
jgi:hypothetical protein